MPAGAGLLVIDDAHALDNHDCQDIIAGLADHVPYGSQLAIASRAELPLPVERMRAQAIVCIGLSGCCHGCRRT